MSGVCIQLYDSFYYSHTNLTGEAEMSISCIPDNVNIPFFKVYKVLFDFIINSSHSKLFALLLIPDTLLLGWFLTLKVLRFESF